MPKAKPVSLHPLTFKQALTALVSPRPKKKRKRKDREMEDLILGQIEVLHRGCNIPLELRSLLLIARDEGFDPKKLYESAKADRPDWLPPFPPYEEVAPPK